MKIKRIRIQNFRCLEDLEIEFDAVTTFIGPNGTGKSTILRALDWFFNSQSQKTSTLTDDDCTFGSGTKKITIEVEFSDLTPEDRQELGHYAPAGSDTFIAWKYREEDGREKMTGNAKAYEPFDAIRSAANATAMKVAYRTLRDGDTTLGLPVANNKDAINDALIAWELANPAALTDSQQEVTNFFGFNSQAKMAGLFDFVFVGADLRASEEIIDNKSTTIGRILERAIDRSGADAEIETLATEVKERQQDIYDRNFQQQLVALSNELTSAVSQYTVSREVQVQTKELEIQPPKTQFNLSVMDSTIETPVANQGHGFQRALLISALQLLAKRGSAGQNNGTICLAIEEPELFQHPVQAQAFSQVLRSLADDTAQNIQIVYATHSPYFVSPRHFNEIRRVTRVTAADPTRSPSVTIKSTSIAAIQRRLHGYVDSAVIDRQIEGVCLNRLPEALFASGTIIVEGTTDQAALEGGAERPGSVPLVVSGIVVSDAGSKNNLFLHHAILIELGIPCYLVFDGDKEVRARMLAKGRSQGDITSAENQSKALNRKILKYLGESEVDWPTNETKATYAVLEDTLESWLQANWPEWEQEKDAIITAGLGSPEKNAFVYRQAARDATAEPPGFLADIITKAKALM